METIDPNGVAVQPPTVIGGTIETRDVLAWVERADNYAVLARRLVRSFFVPQSYRPQLKENATAEQIADAYAVVEANAVGAMMLGGAIGLDPLTSLQNIYVVHARPGMYAKLKVALAQAAGHDVWVEELTPARVTVCGRRKGWPQEQVVRVTITMDQARQAGWTSNAAYTKTPMDMLYARAASRAVDQIAADTLHGIASIEDIEDIEPEPAPAPRAERVSTAEVLARRPVPVPALVSGPPTVPVTPEPTEVLVTTLVPSSDGASFHNAEPGTITEEQWQKINARFCDLGVTGPGKATKRLTALSALVGRYISKGSELSAADAVFVLDNMAGDVGKATVRGILAHPTVRPVEHTPASPPVIQGLIEAAQATTGTDAPTVATQDPDNFDPTLDPSWGTAGEETDTEPQA
jgi:hypothetical protein